MTSAGDAGPTWAEARAAVLRHAADPNGTDDVAELLWSVFDAYWNTGRYLDIFGRTQARGVHLTPVDFYWPTPNTAALPESLWTTESELPGVDMNEAEQLRLLGEVFPRYREEYERFPTAPTDDPAEFHLGNDFFDGTDALALHCMVRHFAPSLIIEIGSGYSTRISAAAARANGNTRLVCIEPYPVEALRRGIPGVSMVRQVRVQDVPLSDFAELGDGDVLFIDSSHVVNIGSDVNYLLLEVVPRLASGVIVHVHDIFFPLEYRRSSIHEMCHFWNEQYLLQALLAFNADFEVLLCNSYLERRHLDAMKATFPTSPWFGGGSFWMRRR